ncbi:uncharacterized protein LOC117101921 [Anneissia japonica]|uniref:uncharacterized protein LOC117101921 n=1 Tax=Anneissia japonica TaxID=1529436 RepID=UPI0014255E30|nr:uncharacterized protein LOC117101921 [Anneissia japonica]
MKKKYITCFRTEFAVHVLFTKHTDMENRGYSFEKKVEEYLRKKFGSSNVKSEVPMNGSKADFVVCGNQIWEAKSSPKIEKEDVSQAARIAEGRGKAILAVGRDARVSDTVQQYARSQSVKIKHMDFN